MSNMKSKLAASVRRSRPRAPVEPAPGGKASRKDADPKSARKADPKRRRDLRYRGQRTVPRRVWPD